VRGFKSVMLIGYSVVFLFFSPLEHLMIICPESLNPPNWQLL